MKKHQEHKLSYFKAARLEEADHATNDAFKRICKKRISTKEYKFALEQLLKAFKIK
jgi:hypothetical protein